VTQAAFIQLAFFFG